MENYEPITSFNEDVAETYIGKQRGDETMTVAFLEQLSQGGHALKLAIGAGRIALPLAAKGIRADGIDFSSAMVAKLRAQPGGSQIEVTLGDFADVAVSDTYRLIYVVYNTLFNLLTQDEQVRCFEKVANHLTDDGSFVVEGFVPAFLHKLRNDQYVDAEAIQVDEVQLDVLRHDTSRQMIDESPVSLSAAGVRLTPIVQRYTWPSELDLMARIAGLCLKERWGGWNREPFTSNSPNCVSIFGR
jgi:SAM-dependent methyltransferase